MRNSVTFTNARLLDGTGSPARPATVTIIDGKVAAVGGVGEPPQHSTDEVIDLRGRTLMPGLIDAHTHLTYHSGEYGLMMQQMNESLEFNTIKAVENAHLILETGCTAIGDGGTRGHIASAIRDAVDAGVILGPKVVAAGPMLSGSGGIQDHTAAWGYYDADAYLGQVVNGPNEVRKAVRQQIRSGVDWVKVTASGLPGTPWIDGKTQDLSYEEIRAAVEEAAKFKKFVHAHAHDRAGIRASAQAGAISLHSGEFAREEDLQSLIETGCIFVPTIAWLHFRTNEDYAREYLRAYKPSEQDVKKFINECQEAYECCRDAVILANKLGVPTAIGTDAAHVFPPYDMVFEMEYIQDLGVPASTVVRWATQMSAQAVGRGEVWGTVEPGKDADFLIVNGEPDADVRVLRDKKSIEAIIQNGELVKGTLPGTLPLTSS